MFQTTGLLASYRPYGGETTLPFWGWKVSLIVKRETASLVAWTYLREPTTSMESNQ